MLGDVQAGVGERLRQRIKQRRPAIGAHAERWRVAVHDRSQDLDPTARSKRADDREHEAPIAVQDRPQQRTPRQGDPHLVDLPAEHGERRRRIADQEQRVRQAALARRPGRAAGRFAQPAGVGVYANRENARIVAGGPKHGRAITGTQVDDRPRVGGDQQVDLADVELGELTSNDAAHHARDSNG